MSVVAPFVAVVMSEEPDAIVEPPVELAQEGLQRIPTVLTSALPAQLSGQGSRSLMRNHVIDPPAYAVERGAAVVHLLLARHLLGPPAPPLLAILSVVARGAAHGKDRGSRDVEYPSAHEVQHVRSYLMDETAAPLPHRQFCQGVVVLMVAVYETRGPGLRLEPVEPIPLSIRAVPDKAEVAGHDHHVIARQRAPQRPRFEGESAGPILGPAVDIACHIDRHQYAPHGRSLSPSLTIRSYSTVCRSSGLPSR